MTHHTVIPDIHADLERLQQSLRHASTSGQVLFLGDFIDAGKSVNKPGDVQVLEVIRALISDRKAMGVMGNHELNAILYHAKDENGAPMRQHSPKNQQQHQSFIDEFGVGTARAVEWTEWFLEALPLWAELDGLRLLSDHGLGVTRVTIRSSSKGWIPYFARKHGEEPELGWFDPGLEVGPCSSEIDALISEARSTLVH
jgi:predicted MPP superfamily phosphohydrolase